MNQSNQQAAQTAANALSGEKAYRSIGFAITGDKIADFLAGISALITDSELGYKQTSEILRAASRIQKANYKCEKRMLKATMPAYPPQAYSPNMPPPYGGSGLGTAMSQLGNQIQNEACPWQPQDLANALGLKS